VSIPGICFHELEMIGTEFWLVRTFRVSLYVVCVSSHHGIMIPFFVHKLFQFFRCYLPVSNLLFFFLSPDVIYISDWLILTTVTISRRKLIRECDIFDLRRGSVHSTLELKLWLQSRPRSCLNFKGKNSRLSLRCVPQAHPLLPASIDSDLDTGTDLNWIPSIDNLRT